MKILHIDDNVEITNAFSHILTLKGYDYTYINDGKEGVNTILEKDFDIILLDLAMPKFSGFDVLKEIRSKGYDKKNIIVVTAVNLCDEEKMKLKQLGVDSLIAKPITIKDLLIQIKKQDLGLLVET